MEPAAGGQPGRPAVADLRGEAQARFLVRRHAGRLLRLGGWCNRVARAQRVVHGDGGDSSSTAFRPVNRDLQLRRLR